MNAKELIALNNEKQKLLSAENEAYYGDILVYIRLQPGVSEELTEELVMELLDDLCDEGEAGKTVQEVFDVDPKGFSKDMIRTVAKEQVKDTFNFVAGSI